MIVKGVQISNNLRVITAHVMTAFTDYSDNLQGWISGMKSDGYNHFWLFSDSYDSTQMKNFFDAAQAVGGVTIMPGNQITNADVDSGVNMIRDYINHPIIYRYKGKPVFGGYEYNGNLSAVLSGLAAYGISKNDFNLFVNSHYAHFFGGVWNDGYGFPDTLASAQHLFSTTTNLDGVINFSVDKSGGSSSTLQNIINENTYIAQAAVNTGKVAFAGINHNYASAQFTSYGFSGTLSILTSILSSPLNQWPLGIVDVTANDYVERSYMSRSLIPPVNGLSYIPSLSSAFNLGDNTPYPILDNSGINAFLKPWKLKFKASDTTPVVITQDRIFCWYMLHPLSAAFITTVPSELVASRPATVNGVALQTWWNGTMYAGADASGAGTRILGIKTYMPSDYSNIKMAAHLVTAGYLRIAINGHTYTSALQQPGAAFYEVAQELGTPVFSIINADGTTVRKTGTGPQAITTSCWPGGWSPLIAEV